MDGGFAFFDIVFFAMVAAFLILRLRSVLGRRTGNEKPERWTTRKPPQAGRAETPDNVARLPDRNRPAGRCRSARPFDRLARRGRGRADPRRRPELRSAQLR